jgi:hypothetical protein
MSTRKGQLTKSILVSGGMQDDVSEYLQSDPACAYIENGRFRKKDEIEKRLPDAAMSTTGLPTEGQPLMLAAPKGESLLTLDPDGVLYSYDEEISTTWETRQTNILPYSAESYMRSAAEPGMSHVQANEATHPSIEKYKLMVWEKRNQGNVSEIVAEVRKPNGDLTFRERWAGYNPRIRNATVYREPVIFYDGVDGKVHYAKKSGTAFAHGAISSVLQTTAPDIQGLIDHNPSVPDRNYLRPGFSIYGRSGGYWGIDFGFPGADDTDPQVGALAFIDTTGRVKIAKMNTYSSSSTEYTVEVAGTNDIYTVLDVAYNTWDNETGILLSKYDPVTATGELEMTVWDHNTNSKKITCTIDLNAHVSIKEGRAINGSLVWDDSVAIVEDRWRFAATCVGGKPWENNAFNYLYNSTVITGHFDDFTGGFWVSNNLSGHILASEATFDRAIYGGYAGDPRRKLVFAVEQFNPHAVPNITGDNNNTPNYTNEFCSVPVLIRPHTTIVIATTHNYSGFAIVATLGAGQNKCINASSAEQSNCLNGAYVNYEDDDEPRICTRNVLQPQDISWHWSNPSSTGWRANVLFDGEAAGKVTKLAPATSLQSRVYGETTLFSSAVPSQYDGVTFGEQSVFDQPEIVSISQGAFTGTDTDLDYKGWAYEKLTTPSDLDDWFVFQIVMSFADHKGHLHRSAPSTPLWISGMEEAQNFDTMNLTYTPPLSAYGAQKEYFVEVFVGQGEGAMHLAATKTFTPGTGTPYIEFDLHQRVQSDWKYPVRWSEVLYTEGSVLPSDPWPSFNDFVLTSNRMFAVSAEVPGTIYYSKLLEENINPEFSAPLVISLGRNRNLTAIGAIDDKVIIFTDDNEIFAIYDTGPDNTGANGDFIVDRLQTTVGCSSRSSLVEVPDGLLFYSDRSKEFHILSRDLQIHDIGKPIEDTANAITEVHAAIVFPDEHEVRWYVSSANQLEFGNSPTTATGGVKARPPRPRYQNILPVRPALVYNYHYKKWCVHSLRDSPRHVTLYNNVPTWIDADFNVYTADDTAWGEEQHKLKLRTPWIRVNQLQSYGRIDEAAFLAKYLSDWRDNGNGFESGDIQVTVQYDYEEDTSNYDPNDTNSPDVYLFRANAGDLGGKGQTTANISEGGPVPVEYNFGRCQFSVHPGRPKCQAIRFEIEDVPTVAIGVEEPTDYVQGRGFSIAGFDLLYSPKTGQGTKTTPTRTSK